MVKTRRLQRNIKLFSLKINNLHTFKGLKVNHLQASIFHPENLIFLFFREL